MTLNRAAFFAAVRARLGALTQPQVDGISAILAAWDKHRPDAPLAFVAYALATALHETARTMQPIREHGGPAYFHRMYDKAGSRPKVAAELGNTEAGDGARFHGRGYVQLTGRRNYALASRKVGVDLVAAPDRAMEPAIAGAVMVLGMIEGWFTGRRLSHYFGAGQAAPVSARRIINGTDQAEAIAGHHRSFVAALQAGGYAPGAAAPKVSTAPVSPTPVPVPVTTAKPVPSTSPATPGFWARLFRRAA